MAAAQHLFQWEPEAPGGAEEEADWAQLELRARAVLQRTLEQEVTSQSALQVGHSVVLCCVFKATNTRTHTHTNQNLHGNTAHRLR